MNLHLVSLDFSYEWNHKTHGLLHLASFTWYNVFKVHASYSRYLFMAG